MFKFPWSLLKGKWIIGSHDSWAKQMLLLYLALIASKYGLVYIIPYQPIKYELIDQIKSVVEKLGYNEDKILILPRRRIESVSKDVRLILYYEIPYTPKIDFNNIIVFTTPGSSVRKYPGWNRIMLKKIEGNEYMLKTSEAVMRIVISVKYIGPSKGPTGIYGEALDHLRRGIIEFGQLTVRDAVEIIMYNMGLSKDKAREVLGYLVRKGYVQIKGKEIIVY